MRHLLFVSLIALTLASFRTAFAEDSAEKNAETAMASSNQSCDDLPDTRATFDNRTHKFKGCRVTSVKAGSAYDKMGLKTGDIVDPSSAKAHSMQEAAKMDQGR